MRFNFNKSAPHSFCMNSLLLLSARFSCMREIGLTVQWKSSWCQYNKKSNRTQFEWGANGLSNILIMTAHNVMPIYSISRVYIIFFSSVWCVREREGVLWCPYARGKDLARTQKLKSFFTNISVTIHLAVHFEGQLMQLISQHRDQLLPIQSNQYRSLPIRFFRSVLGTSITYNSYENWNENAWKI